LIESFQQQESEASSGACDSPPGQVGVTSFVLDEGCAAQLLKRTMLEVRWTEFSHAPQRERGLVLLAGEQLELPALRCPPEPVLWLRCMRGLPRISDDGLDVEVWGSPPGDMPARLLLSLRLENAQPQAGMREVLLDLPLAVDEVWKLELRCEPGPQGQSDADWLALIGLVVCAGEELPLLRARSHHAWRLANEIEHFSRVYSNAFYRDRHVDRRGEGGAAVGPVRPLPVSASLGDARERLRAALLARLQDVPPRAGEHAYGYATRMLGKLIPERAPDFVGRLRQMSASRDGQPLHMLALCAGEAAVEGQVLAQADVPVELCIVDVNAGLLEQATLRMPPSVTVDRVLGDANDIGPQLGRFDVICITSGLHHLVELERVLGAIAKMLRPGGEFWLIGEQVGRNGNRLWPEASDMANRVFAAWPEAKRLNHNTAMVDKLLPDVDCSASSFEGIRSQDILGQLDRHFLPVARYLRNAFLWRLVDVAYAANFDLAAAADRELLMDATVEEAMHWACGGRGTELHAVYRSKWADMGGLALA